MVAADGFGIPFNLAVSVDKTGMAYSSPLQFAQCLPSTFHPHAQPFHRVGYQTFSGQIGFLDHHLSKQPVRHDRGGRAGGFHHADEDRSPDASGPRYRGLAAGTQFKGGQFHDRGAPGGRTGQLQAEPRNQP